MLFSSWQFIFVFLPIAVAGFFAIPARAQPARKWWLLLTSLFFYGWWKVEYVSLLLFSIAFNFAAAEAVTAWRGRPAARWALTASVSVNLLLLGYYKYTNFLLEALGRASGHTFARLDIMLPLAISFFTFTQIGYLVDVFRNAKLHYRLLDYAVFVVFFPHLIAGPIVRHWEIIPQFANRQLKANRNDMGAGIAMFLLGLFKKVLLADPASRFADIVYGAAESGPITWFDGWLGTIAYAMQIYFDFSGYSDMAIGLARMFGMKFPCNFDSPYQAGSIVEFWRRWHITLQRFLREYLYFPLGGNRCGKARHLLNILITMIVSGLWHGAGWTFLVWGALHGAYLVIAHGWRTFREARGWRFTTHWSYRGACVIVTFIAVLYAWVFFRAKTLPQAGRVIASMAGLNGFTIPEGVNDPKRSPGPLLEKIGFQFTEKNLAVNFYKPGMRWMAALLLIVFFAPNTQQLLRAAEPVLEPVAASSRMRFAFSATSGLVLGVLLFFVVCSWFIARPSPFIYFNF